MKPCIRCGSTDRYKNGRCILCAKQYTINWRKNNPDKLTKIQARYRSNNSDKIAKAQAEYKKNHKEKIIKIQTKWRKANPEKVAKNTTRWRKNNSEREAKKQARWRKKNPEKVTNRSAMWRKKNPEKVTNYVIANRSARITYCHNRRARKAGNGGTHTAKQWKELLASYHRLCVYCFNPATTRDHIIPIANGGTNNIENIVPACNSCNDSKGSKSLLKWLVYKM